jgi:MFS family permease
MATSLLRDRSFRHYWAAGAVSFAGDGVTSVVLPLTAVSALGAGAGQMGLLTALMWLPCLLFSIPLGALVDRLRRQRAAMVAADLARFTLVASVVLCAVTGTLTLLLLYSAIFVVGTFSALYTVSDNAFFVSLVRPNDYVRGQALVRGGQCACQLAGPSLGGLLVTVISPPITLIIDALSFLASALLLGSIPTSRRRPSAQEPGGGVRRSGLGYILHTPVIRTLVASAATVNFFYLMFNALFVLYLTDDARLDSWIVGIAVSVPAFGIVVGASVAGALIRRFGIARTLVAGTIIISAPLPLVATVTGQHLVAIGVLLIAVFICGVGFAFQNVGIGATFSDVVPIELQSTVRGAFVAISFGIRPLGALLGGFLGVILGARPTLVIAGAGGLLAVVWLIGLSRRMRAPGDAGSQPA